MNDLAVSVVSHSPQTSIIGPMVGILVIATLVGIISHRIKLPYTVSLMVVGIGLSFVGLVPNIDLTRELLLGVFLPALLFEAAIHFPSNELKKFAPTIATLAAPGVILTAFATALLLVLEITTFRLSTPMTFVHYLLFGTIIAATDPIAVIALFKQLGVKRKIAVILEGESLFNDGTAIVLYTVVLTALTSGVFSVQDGALLFITEALFGISIGAVCGAFSSFVIPFSKDPLISIAITTVTAYGTYLFADFMHASGVLATATAGLFLGNMGKKEKLEPSNRMAVVSFWRYVSFFVSSIVFLLIGLKVDVLFLFEHIKLIGFAFLAVLASRAISVYLPIGMLSKMSQPMNFRVATALWWGGLRGSLSMVLVLSIPDNISGKNELIAMTFGVVVLSVLVQGSTMGFVIKMLGLVEKRTDAMRFMSKSIAKLKAISEQQKTFTKIALEEEILEGAKDIASSLRLERQEILAKIKERQDDPDFINAKEERLRYIRSRLDDAKRNSLMQSQEFNLITEEDLNELIEYEVHESES